MSVSASQDVAGSANASAIQFTVMAKQLSAIKQQGQQMVETLAAISKSIDTGRNFDAQA